MAKTEKTEDRRELVRRAADFLIKTDGTAPVALRLKFLEEEKGLTGVEIMEAMNLASGGELVRVALSPQPEAPSS